MAVQNNPRIEIAEDDLKRSRALASVTKDAYIPTITANGGAGESYGITLNVPTILTVNAQSLIYSAAQRSYLRGARLNVEANALTLIEVREQVAEETASSYLELDHLSGQEAVLVQISQHAVKLRDLVRKRVMAGLETEQALNEAERTVVATQLQMLQLEDRRAYFSEHLASLVGTPGVQILTQHDSIPDLKADSTLSDVVAEAVWTSPALLSAEANASSKHEQAHGDARYVWRPQVSFASQYGRISPINDVSDYYNLHGKYNTGFLGVSVFVPILDAAHKARARESAAGAMQADHQVLLLQAQQREDALKLRHSLAELAARARIAELDEKIAENQLQSVLIEVRLGGDGGPALTPRDEENARIRERQQQLAVLDAHVQLQKAQITLLRRTRGIESWLGLSLREPQLARDKH
ncbi:MAG: TolC family protein [Janthinobacterium lividum]